MERELEHLRRTQTMSDFAAFQYMEAKRKLEELPKEYIDPEDEPHIELGYN